MPARDAWKDLTAQELRQRLERAPRPRVVDVRELHELTGELGRIEGVEHVPLASVRAGCVGWSRDEEIVVVCRSGGRSAKAAEVLAGLGFQRILNLAGGMAAWNAAALPIVRRGLVAGR
jgi:sulfur-carrier protein adenylyltransferase/sulfurtransferase